MGAERIVSTSWKPACSWIDEFGVKPMTRYWGVNLRFASAEWFTIPLAVEIQGVTNGKTSR